MTQESRNLKTEIIKKNCGSCCHNHVCKHKGAFDSVVSRAIHEVQADDYLALVIVKCKFHMFTGGFTFEIANQDTNGSVSNG